MKVVFHRLSNIDRDSIILPEGLLSRIHMSDVQRNWEKIKTGPNKKKQGQP